MITVARTPNTSDVKTPMWHWLISFDNPWYTNGTNLISSGHMGSPLA